MVMLVNASLYGNPHVNVEPHFVKTITQERTEVPTCTIRVQTGGGHYRVVGSIDQVCEALGLNKQDVERKEH